MSDTRCNDSAGLVGTPSDEVPEILAAGRSGITTLFVSMAERHPHGADAQYLRWHTLDHRPEQHRLASVQASLRVVSTPACRAARAASDERCDAIDHVMTYFFADTDGLENFNQLSKALYSAGRVPFVLTPVQRGVYTVETRVAAPRAKAGADVLPWWPARGVYLLLEQGAASARALADVPGVAGLWSASSVPTDFSTAGIGQQITYCFLDDDAIETAERLRSVLEQRWKVAGIQPLLAAPFYPIVPYEWERYLP
jgi:hypothetical protein